MINYFRVNLLRQVTFLVLCFFTSSALACEDGFASSSVAVKELSITKLRSLDPTVIRNLPQEEVQKLSAEQIRVLSAQQAESVPIEYLSIYQIPFFTAEQVNVILSKNSREKSTATSPEAPSKTQTLLEGSPFVASVFIRNHIDKITPANISILPLQQIQLLSSVDIKKLSVKQVQALTFSQILAFGKKVAHFSSEQIQAFDENIKYFLPEQLSALSHKQTVALTVKQVAVLGEEQRASLTYLTNVLY